jgi:hypothetical protein
MGDWLDDEIEALRESDRQREHRERLQLHRANVLKTKGPVFFAEVKRAVAGALRRHNEAFAATTTRLLEAEETQQGRTLLVRGKHAHGTLVVSLHPDGNMISIKPKTGAVMEIEHGAIPLAIDEHDNVLAEAPDGHDAEAVVRAIMRPIYASFTKGTTQLQRPGNSN